MSADLEALARRAVACRRWRWMPGMLRLRDAPGKADHLRRERRIERADDWFYSDWPCLPDLADPATLGCLLALVREAWGDSEAHPALGGAGWILMSGDSRVADVVLCSPAGTTEAEALVFALEAAP